MAQTILELDCICRYLNSKVKEIYGQANKMLIDGQRNNEDATIIRESYEFKSLSKRSERLNDLRLEYEKKLEGQINKILDIE